METTATYSLDDVRAAHFARVSPEGPFAELYPDDPAEAAQWQRDWQRGKDLLQTTRVIYSSRFPFGADPFGGRLQQFQEAHPRIVSEIVETSSGFVGTSEQRCYMALELKV